MKDFNSVYTVITAYEVAKYPKSVQKHCRHEKFVTTFWMFGKNAATFSTLFVCVNTGVTENAGMENARRSKSDIGKPETDTITEFNI